MLTDMGQSKLNNLPNSYIHPHTKHKHDAKNRICIADGTAVPDRP